MQDVEIVEIVDWGLAVVGDGDGAKRREAGGC